jgi:hypothetical protein
VDDGWIQSLAYDRKTQCLEVRIQMAQRALIPSGAAPSRARNLESAADEYGSSRISHEEPTYPVDEVRSEGKLLVSLLRGWAIVDGGPIVIHWQPEDDEPKPIEGKVIEIEAHDPDKPQH